MLHTTEANTWPDRYRQVAVASKLFDIALLKGNIFDASWAKLQLDVVHESGAARLAFSAW
jgi:hypothetical protein